MQPLKAGKDRSEHVAWFDLSSTSVIIIGWRPVPIPYVPIQTPSCEQQHHAINVLFVGGGGGAGLPNPGFEERDGGGGGGGLRPELKGVWEPELCGVEGEIDLCVPYEVGDSSAKTSSLVMVSTLRRFDLVDCIISESLGTLDRRFAGTGERSLRADVVD